MFHKIATEEISPDTLEKMIDFDVVYVKMDRARLHVCLWNYLLVAGAERKHIGGKQALHVNLSCNQPIRPSQRLSSSIMDSTTRDCSVRTVRTRASFKPAKFVHQVNYKSIKRTVVVASAAVDHEHQYFFAATSKRAL